VTVIINISDSNTTVWKKLNLYIRLTEHFNTNKLLVGKQFGFRKGMAPEDAIFKLIN